ncbi:hypothetical protein [Chryseobacterium luquanense]|uniref:Uncharacterized protein n=1 Tax=Chryseobacterium luquanense TaxID=2983766 RepID=A0ABT3XZ45_9FLAO|nr:hypothetical protein [Chryseobacterium luquanense]MCX8531174.1 hypothetical protein [Chryseobacterium luquanense]
MELSVNAEIKSNDVVKVVLALLDKDLQEMMNYCTQNKWKFEMLNSNNLQLFVPYNSLHLLFYLGHQILSGTNNSELQNS